jgi:hypothetical protein
MTGAGVYNFVSSEFDYTALNTAANYTLPAVQPISVGSYFLSAPNLQTILLFGSAKSNLISPTGTANRWFTYEGDQSIFTFPGTTVEDTIKGYANFLGTWLFVAVVAGSIFFMHIVWKWPYEIMYPFGLICGAILGHPTVAIIEPWWLIAAVALIAALYIYRLVLAPNSESSDGG